MEMREVFEVLSKGIIVSVNSIEFEKIANYLLDDDNFKEFDETVKKLGFYLVGENGYFYLSKSLKNEEVDKFLNNHKNIILSIAQLKKIFVHLDRGFIIKKSEFIKRFDSKKDDSIIKYIFKDKKNLNIIDISDKLFTLLEKSYVLEKKNSDEYLVLNSIYYYLDIVEMLGDENE